MAYVFTNEVVLLDSNFTDAAQIRVQPRPHGTSNVYYFDPLFIIRPWPGEGPLPPSITIDLEVRILRPEIFRFGTSMAVAKRYLLNSTNTTPIGFTIRTLQDLDELNFHQMAILFKTRDDSENFGSVENPFGFDIGYSD